MSRNPRQVGQPIMASSVTLKPMKKSALILDFGGVITQTLFEQHCRTEQVLGLPPGTLTWFGPLDPDTDELWRRVRRGEMTESVYWRIRASEVGSLLGKDWDATTFFMRAQGGDPNATVRPEAMVAVRRLKAAGVHLAVLSNELERFYGPEFRARVEILAEFDIVIDGTHTQILKPERQAYELCLQALEVQASDTVFVDDQLRNVEGARMAGLDAIHFDIRKPAESYTIIERRFSLPRR